MAEEARLDSMPFVAYALDTIQADYGDRVSVDNKKKPLLKFGENEATGTTLSEVSTFPSGVLVETLSTTSNNITSVVSSHASDTGTITYEGHYFNSGVLFFLPPTSVTLTGQTAVTLPTAMARVTRAKSTSLAAMNGNVSFYEGGAITSGVPNTAANVHMLLQAGATQTQKCATSISGTDYWIISDITATCLEKTSASSQVRVEVKSATSNIWYPLTQYVGVAEGSGTFHLQFDQYKIVPKNSDVRLVAISSGANIHVAGGIAGWLAN
tara:strand:- start:145 stop:948 length:804 start_codon:yes stop_codon:yes gene_type:complete